MKRVRDTERGRATHECRDCGRPIPSGDPKYEVTVWDGRRVWSEYLCKTHRRPRG